MPSSIHLLGRALIGLAALSAVLIVVGQPGRTIAASPYRVFLPLVTTQRTLPAVITTISLGDTGASGNFISWRLPRFQFEHGQVVPNIGAVFARLRGGLHAVGVWRWFTTANPDLVIGDDETAVSPLEWLRAGLDANRVADLAAEL